MTTLPATVQCSVCGLENAKSVSVGASRALATMRVAVCSECLDRRIAEGVLDLWRTNVPATLENIAKMIDRPSEDVYAAFKRHRLSIPGTQHKPIQVEAWRPSDDALRELLKRGGP